FSLDHRIRWRVFIHLLNTSAVKHILISFALARIGLLESFISHIDRVRVVHVELTAAKDTSAWILFVTVLGLDLVQRNREVLVGGVHVFNRLGKHFLMGWPQQHVRALAVFQAEQVIAIFGPAIRKLIWLTWQKRWE